MYKEYRPYRRFLIAADMVLTLIVFAVVVELRPLLPGRIIDSPELLRVPLLYVTVLFLWTLLFGMTGVYDLPNTPSFSRQAGRFVISYLLAVFVFGGILYFTYREMSRMLVFYFTACNFGALLTLRYGLTVYLAKMLKGFRRSNILIVGTDEGSISFSRRIMEEHGAIYNLIGFADNSWEFDGPLPAPFIGQADEVPRLVEDYDVQMVVIALPEGRSNHAERLIRDLDRRPVRVYVLYDLGKLALLRSEVESFGESLVIGIREPVIQGVDRAIKRAFDLAVSLIVLLAAWPLFLVIWIAIKLDSSGPAIYRAERVGENGRLFEMLKFRTMVEHAESLQLDVSAQDHEGRVVYKTKDDPRVTRVGRFLRRFSLDELPQLINVVKGEMSLVGPRPEQPFIAQDYDHWQTERLAVPPGVTGWWQISGRSDLPMHLNVHLDLYYVRNYSLFLDVKILVRTLMVVLRGAGAY
jgi:exopolysaccharide biosynthesis polyprenyl glycosylphosphotransferase